MYQHAVEPPQIPTATRESLSWPRRRRRSSLNRMCGGFMGPGEVFWVCLNCLSVGMFLTGGELLIEDYAFYLFKVESYVLRAVSILFVFIEFVTAMIIFFRYRGMPYRSIGCIGKATVDVITVCAALMMRIFLAYDFWYLYVLIGLSVYLHACGQILHVISDLDINDVLVEVLMEVVVYMTGNSSYVCPAVLICCVGLISYRYMFYSAPITPDDVKKDVDLLPC